VNRGAEFMATLRLIYPQADSFCDGDFDWLYDCPQTKQFLEWFCSTVGKENVLSPAEVEAYDALLASGKPILEGDALEHTLQTSCQVPQLPSTMLGDDDEGLSLDALKQELQELEEYRDRQLRRHNKLQVWAANLQQELRYMKEEEKVMEQDLKKAQRELEMEAFQTSTVLSQVSKAAVQLAEWCGDTGKGRAPALLCEMDLSPYMELEQQATEVFEQLIQQVQLGSAQAPDAQGASAQGESSQKEKPEAGMQSLRAGGDELLGARSSYWKELCRLQTARISAQREVILMAAKVEANNAALQWAQKTLEALDEDQHAVQEELRNRAGILQELDILRHHIAQTLAHHLPPLLRAEAHLSCLPVLQRQLSLDAAQLQHAARRQEEVAAWLLNQRSRLDLLELLLTKERKEMDQRAASLRGMATALKEAQTRLQEQQKYLQDASSSQKGCLNMWIAPKDPSALWLWDMLMGQDQEKPISLSYETIAAQCLQLVEAQKALEAELAAPIPQVPELESSTKVLYRLLYNSSNQLQLSSPEVTQEMQQLMTMQEKLYEMLAQLLNDLKVKHEALESPILQTEHNLYVYYYCNEQRLREVVEELEKEASAFSR
ncbi:HAUS3 protein, partial [Atlantisia rogersi]|nr:HAUS3 protein [Atlantisia rogersi]